MNIPREQVSLPAQPNWLPWIVPGRRVDPITSVRSHRRLALGVGLIIVALGLTAAIEFGHAEYEVTASVRVLPTYDTRLAADLEPSVLPNIEYSSFVQQQVFEIANPETIIEALRQLGSKASLWQLPNESGQHAAERLLECLQVKWVPDTFLITVSLKGTKPNGLNEIVNAVVNAYLVRQERQELSGTDSRVRLLEQRKTNLQSQVDAERVRLNDLAQELGVSTFGANASDPYGRKLADANLALERQQRQLIIEESYLAALQGQQVRPAEADLDSLAQKVLLDNRDLATQKAELGKQREVAFLRLQGLGANHPGRPVLESELADIDGEIGLLDGKALKQTRSILLGTRSAAAHDKIKEAQTRVDQAKRARDGIGQEVAVLTTNAASFGAKYNQALAVHEQYESHLKALSEIGDRIDLFRLQSQSPGVASQELPALFPDRSEGGKRRIIFVIAIFMAALLGVGIPTVVDLADSRIKSSRELETILKMPVLGSSVGSDTRSIDETTRRIALGILRERRQAGTRVFVITAVGERAGTSSLTLALSNELTELGASTVAVEANALTPDSRYQRRLPKGSDSIVKLFNGSGNGNGKKLDNTILGRFAKKTGQDLCVHTIASASDALPDRMPICQSQRHHRLSMRCVQEILEIALASHDVVLLDAPPVLNAADTAMLVQNSAGVIVVVRGGHDRVPDVIAAVQDLSRLSPPVIGLILRGELWYDMIDRQAEGETISNVAIPTPSRLSDDLQETVDDAASY